METLSTNDKNIIKNQINGMERLNIFTIDFLTPLTRFCSVFDSTWIRKIICSIYIWCHQSNTYLHWKRQINWEMYWFWLIAANWYKIPQLIITRGQFWPSGIVITCVCGSVCVCVCVCINYELVRSITHHPVKLGSPNLDQRCKTPWFGSLLFLGMIDLDLQGQI